MGTQDAVIIGLGAMIGAGIFAAVGPAARAIGNALPLALLLAAGVAYLNANAVARLAAVYPESGGVYVYGQRRLGPLWGFLAGWGFVVGKMASCVAMAMTFAYYATPEFSRPLAVFAVLALTAVNYLGIRKTVFATRLILALVLVSLGLVVFAGLAGGEASPERLWPWVGFEVGGLLQATGLLFFAFAGYARLATLGEEVVDPVRTIPRAIPIALGLTLFLYACVLGTALLTVNADRLAQAPAPLALVAESGSWGVLSPAVRFGATLASLGALLSLLAGVGRTSFAMAANGDLPRYFSAVHPKYKVPHRAELAIGLLVASIAAVADLRGAIGFSSFAILVYYAIANLSAWTLPRQQRKSPRWMAALGLIACLVVAVSLPLASVVGGALVLGLGAAVHFVRRRCFVMS